MRGLIIGDIHGETAILKQLLAAIHTTGESR